MALIENETPFSGIRACVDDEEFSRGKAPMTKSEIRSLSVAKLHLEKDSVVYDVGAGTGSVTIELALAAADGMVYAVERNQEACDLIEQNKRLNLEKQNYELKEKLREYENQNRSALAKTADLFVDEARKNLTKYAARTATDMLTAALDSKLKGTEYEGVAKMAKESFNLDAILKNATGKK